MLTPGPPYAPDQMQNLSVFCEIFFKRLAKGEQ